MDNTKKSIETRKYKPFKYSLLLLYFFNVVDAIFSQITVSKKLTIEANPIMKFVMDKLSFGSFLAIKIVIMAFILFLFWIHRYDRKARIFGYIMMGVYGFNFIYQMILTIIFTLQ